MTMMTTIMMRAMMIMAVMRPGHMPSVRTCNTVVRCIFVMSTNARIYMPLVAALVVMTMLRYCRSNDQQQHGQNGNDSSHVLYFFK